MRQPSASVPLVTQLTVGSTAASLLSCQVHLYALLVALSKSL